MRGEDHNTQAFYPYISLTLPKITVSHIWLRRHVRFLCTFARLLRCVGS